MLNSGKILSVLLKKFSLNTATPRDILIFQDALYKIYFSSAINGYHQQVSAINEQISRFGVELARELADNRARAIAQALTKAQSYQYGVVYRHLTGSLLTDGLTKGKGIAAFEFNLATKKWVHLYPTKSRRPWHERLDGTTIPVNEKFLLSRTGERVTAPHAWSEVAEPEKEWINCGCTVIYLP